MIEILEPTPSLFEPLIMKHHIFLHDVRRSWGSDSIVRRTPYCNTTCLEPSVHTLTSHNELSIVWSVPVHDPESLTTPTLQVRHASLM